MHDDNEYLLSLLFKELSFAEKYFTKIKTRLLIVRLFVALPLLHLSNINL